MINEIHTALLSMPTINGVMMLTLMWGSCFIVPVFGGWMLAKD